MFSSTSFTVSVATLGPLSNLNSRLYTGWLGSQLHSLAMAPASSVDSKYHLFPDPSKWPGTLLENSCLQVYGFTSGLPNLFR